MHRHREFRAYLVGYVAGGAVMLTCWVLWQVFAEAAH